MYTCDCCTVNECQKGTKDKLPKNCPMHFMEMYTEPMKEYEKEENREFVRRLPSADTGSGRR